MSAVQIAVRVDSELKENAEQYLSSWGLDLSTAVRVFLTKVVETRSIPFSIGENYVSYDRNGKKLRYNVIPDRNGVISDGDAFYSDDDYFKQIPGFMEKLDEDLASTERYSLKEAGWNI